MARTLLLADSSPTIQRVVELIFSDEDVQVVSVGDGEQAIARIESDTPDIVLADIGVPRRNGYDIAAFITGHATLKNVPVLLLTGAFEAVDDARVRASGAVGVVAKPFEPRHLIERVLGLIGGPSPASSTRERSEIPRAFDRLTPSRVVSPPDPPPAPLPAQPRSRAVSEPAAAPPQPSQPSRPLRLVVTPPVSQGGQGKAGDMAQGLEDYFDQLDAAFAARAAENGAADTHHFVAAASSPLDRTMDVERDVSPIDADLMDLAGVWAQETTVAPTPEPAPETKVDRLSTQVVPDERPSPENAAPPPHPAGAGSGSRDDVASMADAFSALLAAEQGGHMAHSVTIARRPESSAIDDELVERTAERVIERLTPLIREEVERLLRGKVPGQ